MNKRGGGFWVTYVFGLIFLILGFLGVFKDLIPTWLAGCGDDLSCALTTSNFPAIALVIYLGLGVVILKYG